MEGWGAGYSNSGKSGKIRKKSDLRKKEGRGTSTQNKNFYPKKYYKFVTYLYVK
jgi:hypothetical protein